MIGVWHKLNAVLSSGERHRGKLVFALVLVMALLEMVGVASIMPFVALLANPQFIDKNKYLSFVYHWLGFESTDVFLFYLGLAVLVFFTATLIFKALTTYAIHRFSNMLLHTMACRLLGVYLRQPYVFFLGRNTADLGKSILAEVTEVAIGVMVPALRILSSLVVSIAIIGLLLYVSPLISLMVTIVLGGAYSVIYILTRQLLKRIGEDRLVAERERFILCSEALGGIKELRLMGREMAYLDRFRDPSKRYAKHKATWNIIGELPNLAVQWIAFGSVMIVLLYMIGRYGMVESALPLISLYAFAGYRLLPRFQEIFRNMTRLRFSFPALEVLYDDLALREERATVKEVSAPLNLRKSIRLEDVTYRYPGAEADALSGISIAITAGSSVGFIGSTGAGKSTAVDIILGLLEPCRGRVLVDDQPLAGNRIAAWQRNLGYVPQSIYLADDTVAANIAFGIPHAQIDQEAVVRAARIAHIDEFISKNLLHGYDTLVGERGIRLSGGERQRLAIARALYHNPDIVVFDEATSALDNVTERIVMEAIKELHGLKTIILIAHRFTAVRECERIFLLEHGKLVGEGTFAELAGNNSGFQKLAQAYVA